MTAAVTFSWYFILGPVMQQGSETTLAKAVSSAYPLADIVLIACLIILASRPEEHTLLPAVRLLALGLTLIVIADSNFVYWSLHDAYATGTLPDVGWSLGYMLVALGAFAARLAPSEEATMTPGEHIDTSSTASPLPEQRVWTSLLPYVLVPAVGILLVYAWRTLCRERQPGDRGLSRGSAAHRPDVVAAGPHNRGERAALQPSATHSSTGGTEKRPTCALPE